MRKISFTSHSLVLPVNGALYVLSHRGVFTIRSKNIHRVHNILKPHIDGTRDEMGLLAAVPESQRHTLQRYLIKLTEAGALRIGDEAEEESAIGSAEFSSTLNGRSRASLIVGSRSVLIFLQGIVKTSGRRHDVHLFFVTPEQIKKELLTSSGKKSGAKVSFYVVVDGPAGGDAALNAEELDQRAMYARWLLQHIKNLSEEAAGIRLYSLDRSTGALLRLWEIDSSDSSGWRSLPQKMNLVTPMEMDQAPLLIARAAHPYFLTNLTRIGLHYEQLHEELVKEFLTRSLLFEKSRATANSSDATLWTVADSLLRLRARLLELYAEARSLPDNISSDSETDLLSEETNQPDVAYLINVLRLRRGNLPARLLRTAEGLFVYQCGTRRACSFVQEKALRDLLLRLTWDIFYSNPDVAIDEPIAGCDFNNFVTDKRLWQIVKTCEEDLTCRYGAAKLFHQRLRCWGRTIWAGRLESEAYEK